MVDPKDFARQWNYRFPVDYWWRKKHNVAFNSSVHRESDFFTQLLEWHEEQMYRGFQEKQEYKPNDLDFLEIMENQIEKIEDGIGLAMDELRKFKESYGDRQEHTD